MLKGTAREAAAEFFGTFILIAFGVGVVAQTVLSKNANGSFLSINIGWGLAVMLGIYTAGGVSGAHLNPAVTVALAVHRAVPVEQGAAVYGRADRGRVRGVGAGLRHLSRGDARVRRRHARWSRAPRRPPGIFATYPQPFLSIAGGFVDQVVGTMLLMAGVLAVTDQKNVAPPAWLTGPLVGVLVVGDRRRVRLQRRLRDQPGARFRSTPVHVRGGLGIGRVHRRRRLVVGADRRADRRRDPRRVPV